MTDTTKIDAFVQSSPHPTWLATSRGECLYVNPALERLTGLKSDRISQVDWCSFILEEDRAAASASWQRSLASGTPYSATVRLRGFDGVPATVELIAFGHTLNEGTELWLFTGLCVHAATQQYPRLEAQLQATLNVIPAYAWYALPSGALTFVNERTGDYLGLPKDHPLRFGIDTGAEWDAHIPLLHPDDREESRRIWSACVRTGAVSESNVRVRNAEGEYRWFLTRAEPLRASDGTLLYWIGVNLDIDGRKRAEEMVRQNERELRTLIEAIPAYVGTNLPDGSADFISESWLDYAGFSREQAMGWGWASAIHPEDIDRVLGNWRAAVAAGVPAEYELRCRRADGSYHWFLFRSFPLRDSGGNVLRWYGTLTNIDTLKETERALHARERELLGIIETMPAMAWSMSPAGEITHQSPRCFEYCGASSEELAKVGWLSSFTLMIEKRPRGHFSRQSKAESHTG